MSLSESMDIFIRPSAYWSRDMADVQRRAVRLAREHDHPQVGLSHMLVAALDTTGSPAARLLTAVGTDPAAIRAETLQTLQVGTDGADRAGPI